MHILRAVLTIAPIVLVAGFVVGIVGLAMFFAASQSLSFKLSERRFDKQGEDRAIWVGSHGFALALIGASGVILAAVIFAISLFTAP